MWDWMEPGGGSSVGGRNAVSCVCVCIDICRTVRARRFAAAAAKTQACPKGIATGRVEPVPACAWWRAIAIAFCYGASVFRARGPPGGKAESLQKAARQLRGDPPDAHDWLGSVRRRRCLPVQME